MSGLADDRGDSSRLARYLWAFGVLWAAIVTTSLALSVVQLEREALKVRRKNMRGTVQWAWSPTPGDAKALR